MIVGRLLGWLALLCGVAVLVRDGIAWADTGRLAPVVLGQLWFDLAPGSLNLVQAVVQRYIHPKLWDPVITSILFLWAAPFFLILGLVLVLAFQRRGPRRRR